MFALAGPHHSSPLAQNTLVPVGSMTTKQSRTEDHVPSNAKFTDPMTSLNTAICQPETSSLDKFGSESEQILDTIMPIDQREFMNAWASVGCTPETIHGSHELCPSAYL